MMTTKRDQITATLRAGGDDLRWVHTQATGVNNQPLDEYRRRGIVLTNGSGIVAIPIAEYLVMAMLAAAKALPRLFHAQELREWLPDPPGLGELFGTRALIIGYGDIGRATADRLRAFNVSVVAVRGHVTDEPGVIGPHEWRSRLGEFDWVILTAPSTDETRHLIGHPEFAAMKKTAWLLNISRGVLIDQPALVEALKRKVIGGAYLDVTDPEPLPADHELWRLPNVILTPHSSWGSHRYHERAAALFRENLDRYLAGDPLLNEVDLRRGY